MTDKKEIIFYLCLVSALVHFTDNILLLYNIVSEWDGRLK